MTDQPDPLAPFRALADQYAAKVAESLRNAKASNLDEARTALQDVAAGWAGAEFLLRHTLADLDNPRTTPDNPPASGDTAEPPRFTWAQTVAAHLKQGIAVVPITSPDGSDAELWADRADAELLHSMLGECLDGIDAAEYNRRLTEPMSEQAAAALRERLASGDLPVRKVRRRDGSCSPPAPETEPNNLVQVGWYCWRCRAVNTQACRSDNVPIHVPADWAPDMETEIARREEERDDEDPAAVQAAFDAGEKGVTAPPTNLRQQIAKAPHRYDYEHDLSRNDMPSKHHFGEADAVLAVRDEELERLRAAVARVRAIHTPVDTMAGRVREGCMNCDPYEALPWPCRTTEALTGEETPS